MSKKGGVDYFADVWSGRVDNTLQALFKKYKKLEKKLMANQTADEKRVQDAAEALGQVIDQVDGSFQTILAKIEELKLQAQGPAQEPVNFDDELGSLAGQIDRLKGVASAMGQAGAVEAPPVIEEVPIIEGPPITVPATESPLAGESGTTNPSFEGAGPLVEPAPPGLPIVEAPAEGTGEEAVAEEAAPVEEPAPVEENVPAAEEATEEAAPATSDASEVDGGSSNPPNWQ